MLLIAFYGSLSTVCATDNQRLRVSVTGRGQETHTAQLYYNGDAAIVGKVYYIKFKIYGDNRGVASDNKIYAYLQQNGGNYAKSVDFGPIEVPSSETEVIIEKELDTNVCYDVIITDANIDYVIGKEEK